MQSLFVIDSGKLAAAFEESFVMRAISDCEQRQGQWSETDYFCIPFIASSFVFIFSVPSLVNSKIWQTAKSVFFYCHSTVRKPSSTSDHWTNRWLSSLQSARPYRSWSCFFFFSSCCIFCLQGELMFYRSFREINHCGSLGKQLIAVS